MPDGWGYWKSIRVLAISSATANSANERNEARKSTLICAGGK
jgi:hypothetical protein